MEGLDSAYLNHTHHKINAVVLNLNLTEEQELNELHTFNFADTDIIVAEVNHPKTKTYIFQPESQEESKQYGDEFVNPLDVSHIKESDVEAISKLDIKALCKGKSRVGLCGL